MVKKKILILVGGNKKKLDAFKEPGKRLGVALSLASFYDVNFSGGQVRVGKKDIKDFDVIYFRVVGKRIEDASLVAEYAKGHGVKVVDSLYENSLNYPSSLAKSLEYKKLVDSAIHTPKSFFGSLDSIRKNAKKLLGYPFVIKSTTGKKAKDAWLVSSEKELNKLISDLIPSEKEGKKFFAQEFIPSKERIRVLVVGDKVLGGVSRPTKWAKKLGLGIVRKRTIRKVPKELSYLSIKARSALNLDICGVDILRRKNGEIVILEANAAPSWKLVSKYCGVNVEEEILKFLISGSITDSEKIKQEYQKKFKEYGVDSHSLAWVSRGAAHQRFRQMWAEIDFNGKNVLDVGCGFGEMAKFLRKRYRGVSYTGVDLVPEFIEKARKLYPEYAFYVSDYFDNPLKENFDVVLASGVLNSNLADNMGYRKKAIGVMFEHTSGLLAFNMLGAHPQPETKEGSNVWYADSIEILKYCLSLTRRVILRQNYNPRDFTILMYKVKEGK